MMTQNKSLTAYKYSNKHLISNVFFTLLLASLCATSAFAFGGGGSGPKSTSFASGVDAVGVHMGGNGQVNIEYVENTENNENIELPAASDYDGNMEGCITAGFAWCKYNSSCKTEACVSPATILSEEDCITEGYYWIAFPYGACSPHSIEMGDYYCYNGRTTKWYVKSEKECPYEQYKTKESCEDAGYYADMCDGEFRACLLGPFRELC